MSVSTPADLYNFFIPLVTACSFIESGILVILLPSAESIYKTAAHAGEKEFVFPYETSWTTVTSREEMARRYPFMPDRILDNLVHDGAKISVVNWNELTAEKLKYMIDAAWYDKESCDYDLSRKMRRNNSSSINYFPY